MSLQGSQMETDGPTTSYMPQVCHWLLGATNFSDATKNQRSHIKLIDFCTIVGMGQALQVLGAGFPSLYECGMPPLLQSAQLKPDVVITSADSANEIDESDDKR